MHPICGLDLLQKLKIAGSTNACVEGSDIFMQKYFLWLFGQHVSGINFLYSPFQWYGPVRGTREVVV
jgi:hypothetical protein